MISRPCYSNRDEVMRSPDFKAGLATTARVDRAMATAADNIEGELHRQFYPFDATQFYDWPNYQYAYPWRRWAARENEEICALTTLQSPGNTGGSGAVTIPLWQVYLEPVNRRRGFPYNRLELDRSTVAAWGIGPTPQHSIWATGTFGFCAEGDQVATITADLNTADATFVIDNGAGCGAGDVLILGYSRGEAPFPLFLGTAGAVQPFLGERLICTDKTAASTGLTQATGCTTGQDSDNALTWAGDDTLHPGEVIILDQERMLVEQVVNGVATVERHYDGTMIASHDDGVAIWAFRQLTVMRGELGTAAAGWASGTGVFRLRVPDLVRDLSIGEAVNQVLQEVSGYSRTVSSGDAVMAAPGISLMDKWDEARTKYGRKARIGAI